MEQLVWILLAGLAVFAAFEFRLNWYLRQRRRWIELVSEYNIAMIDWCVTHNRPFSINTVLQQNLPNYGALGEWGHKEWDLRVWSIKGLVVDVVAFNTIMRWHQAHRETLN